MLDKDIAHLEEQKKDKFQNVRSYKRKQVQKEITAINKKKAMLENTIQECRQVCCGYRKCFQNRQYENFVIRI